MKLSFIHQLFLGLVLSVAALAHGSVEASIAPDKLVESVTDALVSDIARYRDAIDQVENQSEKAVLLEQYYQHIQKTLEPVVDFNWISLNVMGQYRKTATVEQRRQFREAFAKGLVETYGRGLLTYSDQQIVVLPLSEEERKSRKVVVNQEIRGKDQSYPLQYSMGLNRDGEWKVINVIINGINLGQTFRNQFVQAALKFEGDLDQVIANWASTES